MSAMSACQGQGQAQAWRRALDAGDQQAMRKMGAVQWQFTLELKHDADLDYRNSPRSVSSDCYTPHSTSSSRRSICISELGSQGTLGGMGGGLGGMGDMLGSLDIEARCLPWRLLAGVVVFEDYAGWSASHRRTQLRALGERLLRREWALRREGGALLALRLRLMSRLQCSYRRIKEHLHAACCRAWEAWVLEGTLRAQLGAVSSTVLGCKAALAEAQQYVHWGGQVRVAYSRGIFRRPWVWARLRVTGG
ncbi:hypothetical protein B484DRAFT_414486, partial [Ochromonadaceae sp. CCMP2298]